LSILDIQSFRRADCDTHHFPAVAKVRERLIKINKKHRSFMWRNLNSESQVNRGLGNNIRLRSQRGMQLRRT